MPLGQDEDEPRAQALAALRELILAGEAYRQTFSAYYGVGTTEMAAIGYLHARGDLGQTELARALGITTSTATTLIDRLEARGLAKRVRNADDRRRITVRLTRGGQDAIAHSRRWFQAALDGVPDRDLARTSKLLAGVAEDLRAQVELIEAAPAPRTKRVPRSS
ncbi:MAG: MarR family winged helix-turn-helix transcriptional regulator [Jatrophihabitantaceae bacterium]